MKSPEYIIHGTSSEQDSGMIENEGFIVEEGRATVSADLIYAFKWATDLARRKASKSESKVTEREKGRMVIMKVPDEKSVGYAIHTDIGIDEEKKEIFGYSSKYESGRKQLGIYYDIRDTARKKTQIEISKENVLMSIVPTDELRNKIFELEQKIKMLDRIDLENFTQEIATIVESNKENFLANDIDIKKVIGYLLAKTAEAEIVSMIRSLAMDVKRACGYTVYNRGRTELKEKTVDKDKLKKRLREIYTITEKDNFSTGIASLDRYVKTNAKQLLEELE